MATRTNFLLNFLFSGFSSSLGKIISSPFNNIKILLQNENGLLKSGIITKPFNGIFDCCLRTINSNGIIFLWSGSIIDCLKYFPQQGINAILLDFIKQSFPVNKYTPYIEKLTFKILPRSITGIIGLFFTYPLDYIQTRLVTNLNNYNGDHQFNGFLDILIQTIAFNGIMGLYRGCFITCFGIIIYYLSYNLLSDLVDILCPKKYKNNFIISFILGYSVIVVSELISYPFDTIRRRMMITNCEQVVFNSAFACTKYIILNEGFLSLYKGVAINIFRAEVAAFTEEIIDIIKAIVSDKYKP